MTDLKDKWNIIEKPREVKREDSPSTNYEIMSDGNNTDNNLNVFEASDILSTTSGEYETDLENEVEERLKPVKNLVEVDINSDIENDQDVVCSNATLSAQVTQSSENIELQEQKRELRNNADSNDYSTLTWMESSDRNINDSTNEGQQDEEPKSEHIPLKYSTKKEEKNVTAITDRTTNDNSQLNKSSGSMASALENENNSVSKKKDISNLQNDIPKSQGDARNRESQLSFAIVFGLWTIVYCLVVYYRFDIFEMFYQVGKFFVYPFSLISLQRHKLTSLEWYTKPGFLSPYMKNETVKMETSIYLYTKQDRSLENFCKSKECKAKLNQLWKPHGKYLIDFDLGQIYKIDSPGIVANLVDTWYNEGKIQYNNVKALLDKELANDKKSWLEFKGHLQELRENAKRNAQSINSRAMEWLVHN